METADFVVNKVMSLISVIVVLVLSVFGVNYDNFLLKQDYDVVTNGAVTMVADRETVSQDAESITFTISCEPGTENEYTFGLEPVLQKLVKDEWRTVPEKLGTTWEETAQVINGEFPSASYTMRLGTYYTLSAGNYRLLKEISDAGSFWVAAEFEIV